MVITPSAVCSVTADPTESARSGGQVESSDRPLPLAHRLKEVIAYFSSFLAVQSAANNAVSVAFCYEPLHCVIYESKMSKVIKVEGITILVRSRDEHPPPHVHVLDADNECQVEIGPDGVKLYREESSYASSKFRKKALKLVEDNLAACRQKWRDEVENVE